MRIAPQSLSSTFKSVFSPVKRRLIAVGHSFVYGATYHTGENDVWSDTNAGNRYLSSALMTQLRILSEQAFDFDGNDNYGISGQISPEITARLPGILDARKNDAGAVLIDGLLNNFGSRSGELTAGPYQQSIDDVATWASLCQSAGLHLFLCLIPTTSNAQALSATNLALAGRTRRKLVDLYQSSPYVTVLDGYDAYAEPGSTLGYAITGALRDDLHPGTHGAILAAKRDLPKIVDKFPPRGGIFAPNGNHGRFDATNNPLGGILTNPMLVYTSGGTLGTNGSGTIPDGWEGASNGTPITRAYSQITDAGTGEKWTRVTIAGTPASDQDCNILAQVNPTLLTGAVPNTFEAVARFRASKATGIAAIMLRGYSGGTIFGFDGHYSGVVGHIRAGLSFGPGILRTPRSAISSTTGTFGIAVRVISGVAVDAEIDIQYIDLRPVS